MEKTWQETRCQSVGCLPVAGFSVLSAPVSATKRRTAVSGRVGQCRSQNARSGRGSGYGGSAQHVLSEGDAVDHEGVAKKIHELPTVADAMCPPQIHRVVDATVD